MLYNIELGVYILMLALIPVSFSMLLDFTLGHPGKDEPNVHGIFFGWTFFLAKKKLQKIPTSEGTVYEQMVIDYQNDTEHTIGVYGRRMLHLAFQKNILLNAKEFFTFEHALGMCIFCTNVWVSLLFGIGLCLIGFISIYYIPLIIIFSHLLLRKLN